MKWKRFGMQAVAYTVCIAPPLVATLASFPLFVERSSSSTVSGLALLLLVFCSMPLLKLAGKCIKSPASPFLWVVIFVLSTMLKSIIEEVCIISLIGIVSSGVGFGVFKYTDKKYPSEKGDKQ